MKFAALLHDLLRLCNELFLLLDDLGADMRKGGTL